MENKWARKKVDLPAPAAPAATTSWQRGRKTSDVYLSPEEFAQVTKTFRELQRNNPFLAQLIVEGLNKKQIAARLKWSMQSLNFVLANYRVDVTASVNRRIFRKAL